MKNTKNPPGQIVNDITLGDYVERKYPEVSSAPAKKLLTFDEWWKEFQGNFSQDDVDSCGIYFERCWKAAQENK